MDDNNVPTRPSRKAKSSTQEVISREYAERLKILTYGRYFGRLVFIGLFCISALHGFDDKVFRVSIAFTGAIFGGFWFLEEIMQSTLLIKLLHVIASFEEKTSPKYWQDNYIRFQYSRMYAVTDRVLRQLGVIEPVVWTIGLLALPIVLKIVSDH